MLVQSYFPRDYDTLRGLFGHATADADCIVMQAGHFLLYYDDQSDATVPCLNEEMSEGPEMREGDVARCPTALEKGARSATEIPSSQ